MKVYRAMPEEGWTPVARSAQRDYRLTWRARGLLSELLSYPDGWDTTIDKLVALAREQSNVTEGREAMRKAAAELAAVGYIRYVRQADEHGHWSTVMSVSDVPQPEPSDRRTRNRAVGEPGGRSSGMSVDREVGEPDGRETGTSGDWSITKKTDTKRDIKREDQILSNEYSESLASLAAASGEAAGDDPIEQQLHKIYTVIDDMGPDARRQHLLAVEQRRPKIYRQGRNSAIQQIKQDDPDLLKGTHSVEIIDSLSYKWMVKHYAPNWPQWLTRPLDEAYRALHQRSRAER